MCLLCLWTVQKFLKSMLLFGSILSTWLRFLLSCTSSPLAFSDDHLPGEDTESITMVLFLSYHNSSGILGLDCTWPGVQLKLGFVGSITMDGVRSKWIERMIHSGWVWLELQQSWPDKCWVKNEQHKRWGKLVANMQRSSLLFILHKTIRHRTIRNVTIFSIVFDIPTTNSGERVHGFLKIVGWV